MTFTIKGRISEDTEQFHAEGRGYCTVDVHDPYPHSVAIVIRGADKKTIRQFMNGIIDGAEVTITAELDGDCDLRTTMAGIVPTSGRWPWEKP